MRAFACYCRREMVQLKESGSAAAVRPGSWADNEQKTLHWLQTSLSEMRGEISDLNRAVNVSRQLQQQQEVTGQVQLVRSDVAALQAQAADAAAHRSQVDQSMQQFGDQVQRIDRQQQASAAQLERIENGVSFNQAKLKFALISLKKTKSFSHLSSTPVKSQTVGSCLALPLQ